MSKLVDLKKALDQKKDFKIPSSIGLERLVYLLELAERRFHEKSCMKEECELIIKIFEDYKFYEKANEMKSDLKAGY